MYQLQLFQQTRLRILDCLLRHNSQARCCDLRQELKLSKNLLSYHLDFLKGQGFIREVRQGREKCYFLAAAQRKKIRQILKLVS